MTNILFPDDEEMEEPAWTYFDPLSDGVIQIQRTPWLASCPYMGNNNHSLSPAGSGSVPVTFADGEFPAQANPADIRGSYTFADIANSFDVTPEILADAFGIEEADPSTFAVKNLEAMYMESGYEIGTASVRLFVAYYSALPFDVTDQEIYLPQAAADILLAKDNLDPGQIAYLEQHAVHIGLIDTTDIPMPEATPIPAETTSNSEEYIVKGKTTFGELITWGVPQTTIDEHIGASLPDPAVTVKDYAFANGLSFETLKPAMQAEVDKVKPYIRRFRKFLVSIKIDQSCINPLPR